MVNDHTPEILAALREAVAKAAGDAEAAADLGGWASDARARIAWRILLAEPPVDLNDARRRVSTAEPDNAFFDIGLEALSAALAAIEQPEAVSAAKRSGLESGHGRGHHWRADARSSSRVC